MSRATRSTMRPIAELAIGFGASPTLTENLSCDNGENLWVAEGANPAIDASNEICADARAE